MRGLLIATCMWGWLAVAAQAVPTIVVGDHLLLPDTPGQVIQILVVGQGEMVPGLDLFLYVNNGAAPAPIITAVDIIGPGTIFNPNNVGQFDLGAPYNTPGLQPTALTTTASGFVEANGVLAFVTIDTTGLFDGFGDQFYFPLSLTNPDLGPTDFATNPGNDAILVDGALIFVPEPSTLVLAGLGILGLFACGLRHRAMRRS